MKLEREGTCEWLNVINNSKAPCEQARPAVPEVLLWKLKITIFKFRDARGFAYFAGQQALFKALLLGYQKRAHIANIYGWIGVTLRSL